jgi:hypothetical protein
MALYHILAFLQASADDVLKNIEILHGKISA